MPNDRRFSQEWAVSDSNDVSCEQPQPRCRRFSLLDAMILIVGVALVLASGGDNLAPLVTYSYRTFVAVAAHAAEIRESWPRFPVPVRDPLSQAVSLGMQFGAAVLPGMAVIFIILRLRRPRPPWRTLLVQPGMVAALAIAFGLIWVTGLVHILLPDRLDAFAGPWIVVGSTVTVAWSLLASLRRWTAEPGWVDRLGRALGVMAIGTALLGWMMYRI